MWTSIAGMKVWNVLANAVSGDVKLGGYGICSWPSGLCS